MGSALAQLVRIQCEEDLAQLQESKGVAGDIEVLPGVCRGNSSEQGLSN